MKSFICVVLAAALVASATAAQRIALVIGNGAYAVEKLQNPTNDAELVADALRRAKFETIVVKDASKAQMDAAIGKFVGSLKGADSVALIYYAGHGLQWQGRNFLVPIGANISRPEELEWQAIEMDRVLAAMGNAGAGIGIAFFDACRNNPFPAFARSGARGLAPIPATKRDFFVAYATAPGDVAIDGDGANSPFAEALANAIVVPGQDLGDTFKLIALSVRTRTNSRQVPFSTSSVVRDFFFIDEPVKLANTNANRPLPSVAKANSPFGAFTYFPPGDLIPDSGVGLRDYTIYAPDMVFPIENAPAFLNGNVYQTGGYFGPKGTECDVSNYSYPWRDNFCEKRGWSNPICPTGKGHAGTDIRAGRCVNGKAVTDDGKSVRVVATEDGTIARVGGWSVKLVSESGREWTYLHLRMKDLAVKEGDKVKAGALIGFLSNDFGGAETALHLHLELKTQVKFADGVTGFLKVPLYMSLVRAYERKVGKGVQVRAVAD